MVFYKWLCAGLVPPRLCTNGVHDPTDNGRKMKRESPMRLREQAVCSTIINPFTRAPQTVKLRGKANGVLIDSFGS